LLAAPSLAAAAAPAVTISHPWMRFLTARIPAAGYFTLSNGSAQPATLTAAASPD
jgi:copper(I)-binding protein